MIIEIKVPQLSESVSSATLVQWHVKIGEAVTRDQNLIDIETDKVVLETPAPDSGAIIEYIKSAGDVVSSGEVIAKFDTAIKSGSVNKTVEVASTVSKNTTSAVSDKAHEASPAAKKILAEKNINPVELSAGSGRDGRITKADALAIPAPALTQIPTASKSPSTASSLATANVGERQVQRVPMSRLRARIAERLLQSKNENAILSTFNEVNMAPVIALRKQYGEKFEKTYGVKLGFMGFFVKAVCIALERYPILNAAVDGSDIVYHGFIDIGIAVGSPRGLVVPIIRNASSLSVSEIEKQIGEFSNKAKDGKLSLEELTGGTFSISNGGVFGSMLSTPIINPPQSAILGIHATKERAVVENGQIVIRPINYLALSYDHRIIDGREAVLGLVAIKEALEDPARMILGI